MLRDRYLRQLTLQLSEQFLDLCYCLALCELGPRELVQLADPLRVTLDLLPRFRRNVCSYLAIVFTVRSDAHNEGVMLALRPPLDLSDSFLRLVHDSSVLGLGFFLHLFLSLLLCNAPWRRTVVSVRVALRL